MSDGSEALRKLAGQLDLEADTCEQQARADRELALELRGIADEIDAIHEKARKAVTDASR